MNRVPAHLIDSCLNLTAEDRVTNKSIVRTDRKAIVADKHTLGILRDDDTIQVLHASVLKGATFELHPGVKPVSAFKEIRQATVKDFDDFRVSPAGFFEGDVIKHFDAALESLDQNKSRSPSF